MKRLGFRDPWEMHSVATCFARFDRARHVKAVEIIPDWLTFRAIDFGYRASACLWAQHSPTGQLFLIDELLPTNMTTPELVAAIKTREASFGLHVPPRASYCDPAGRAANVQTAQSEFEILRNAGLHPQGRSSSIRDGCVRIMDSLADQKLPLIIAERCGGLIRALSSVKPDRGHLEVLRLRASRALTSARCLCIEAMPVGHSAIRCQIQVITPAASAPNPGNAHSHCTPPPGCAMVVNAKHRKERIR